MANRIPGKRGCRRRSGLGRHETGKGVPRRPDTWRSSIAARRRHGNESRVAGPTPRITDLERDPTAEMLILRRLAHALQQELDCVRTRLRELEAPSTVQ